MSKKVKGTGESPYDDLYIYWLEGRVDRRHLWDDSAFLGNWEEGGYSFLFFKQPAITVVEALVAASGELTLLDEMVMSYEQWQGGRVAPLEVAGFRIVAPWCADAPEAPETIMLDPGMVFGNGLHPTTRHCLEAISMACGRAPVNTAVDLGTGTGVLALAMARSGAKRVLAVDLNALCVRTAADNIRRNGLEDRVMALQGKAEDWIDGPMDLMVANIHYEVLRHLVSAPSLAGKRCMVFSGLLRGEAKAIREQLAALPVVIRRHWIGDGIWHTLYVEHR
jgi:ribosomal protein L11 methyltransferase